VLNDLIGEIEAARELNELEAGFAATGVTTNVDIGLEFRSNTSSTVV
jgi:hypothetical protein